MTDKKKGREQNKKKESKESGNAAVEEFPFKVGGVSFHTSASLWPGRPQRLSSLIKAYSFFVLDKEPHQFIMLLTHFISKYEV